MMNKNNTIYILSGSPASGKTTLSHQLAKQHNAIIHSYDDMPMANTQQSMDGSVKKAWINNMRADLQSGNNVICDGMNLKVKERIEIINSLSEICCKKILVVLRPELDLCLERNRNRSAQLPDFVVKQAYQIYEIPTYDEGWDEIIFI